MYFSVCVCVCICVHAWLTCGGQRISFRSLFSLSFHNVSPGHWSLVVRFWWQATLPNEPSCQPYSSRFRGTEWWIEEESGAQRVRLNCSGDKLRLAPGAVPFFIWAPLLPKLGGKRPSKLPRVPSPLLSGRPVVLERLHCMVWGLPSLPGLCRTVFWRQCSAVLSLHFGVLLWGDGEFTRKCIRGFLPLQIVQCADFPGHRVCGEPSPSLPPLPGLFTPPFFFFKPL